MAARRSTIHRLPPEVRAHIEQRLAEGSMTLDELIADLRQRWPQAAAEGELPSRSAVHRYGQKLERRLAAVKAATEAARTITEHAGDSRDDRSEALTAMVQTELIEAILQLQDADDDGVDQAQRIDLLSKAAKNIATLTRSSVHIKQYRADIERQVLAEQRQRLDALGQSGQVDPAVLAQVIQAAYDL